MNCSHALLLVNTTTVGNNSVDFRKDLEIIKQYTVLNQKNIKRGNLSLTLLMIRIILCIC